MSKSALPSFIVLCVALAACSDSGETSRLMTGPGLTSSFSESSAEMGGSYTLDGPFEPAPVEEMSVSTLQAGAQIAAAATGSRATGHVGFPTGWPNTVIAAEQYSFSALMTDPATLAAKGQFEVMYTLAGGAGTVKIHGDVICMNAFAGNTARVTGLITKVWRNNVPSPITANTHAYWVVVDLGEGAANPDWVSLVRFGPAAIAQNYCVNGFGSAVSPNQEGNVQVQP